MEAAVPPAYLIAAGATWPPLCTVMVAQRFYARRKMNAPLLADDWLTVPALLLAWGLGAVVVAGTALKSIGYPTPPPLPGETTASNTAFQVQTTRGLLWAFQLMQLPMLGFVKLSFVMFYRRIFCQAHANKIFHIATVATAILIVLWTVGLWLGILFICGTDFSAWWRSVKDNNKHCPGTLTYQNGMAISDTLVDLIIFILPIPPVCRLRMSLKRKLATLAIFGMGLITIAASVARMAIFINATRVDFTSHQDNDLLITGAIYWSMNESGFALLSVCLPTLYGLIKVKYAPMRSKRYESYTSSPYSRSRWRSNVMPSVHRPGDNATASEIRMVHSAPEPVAMHSYARKDDGDYHSRDPEWGEIRVVRDVDVSREY